MSETGDIGLPGPADVARAIARLPGDLAALGAERAASGAVERLVFDRAAIRAEVRGSQPAPREVEVVISTQRTYVWCTCRAPGPCVHAAAALAAAAAAAPEPVAAASPVRRLAPLSREELAALLLRRAETDETFSLWLAAQTALHARAGPTAVADVTAYASALLADRSTGGAGRSWVARTKEIDDLEALFEDVADATTAMQPGLGLAVAVAVADVLVVDALITREASDDVLLECLPDAAEAIVAGALDPRLDEEARRRARSAIAARLPLLSAYGYADAFETAIAALDAGRDDARGAVPERLAPRLAAVLADVGRGDEALALARRTGDRQLEAEVLVRLGRLEEALAAAAGLDAHAAAAVLRLAARTHGAFAANDLGRKLSGRRSATGGDEDGYASALLARTLRDTALEAGDVAFARRAALDAAASTGAREDARVARRLFGTAWDDVREPYLARLRAGGRDPDRVAALVEEGLLADALAVVRSRAPTPSDLLVLGAEGARLDPAFVAEACSRLVEDMLASAKSGLYPLVGRLLFVAAGAHAAGGTSEAFTAQIEDLIERYARRRALLPVLRAVLASIGNGTHDRLRD